MNPPSFPERYKYFVVTTFCNPRRQVTFTPENVHHNATVRVEKETPLTNAPKWNL